MSRVTVTEYPSAWNSVAAGTTPRKTFPRLSPARPMSRSARLLSHQLLTQFLLRRALPVNLSPHIVVVAPELINPVPRIIVAGRRDAACARRRWPSQPRSRVPNRFRLGRRADDLSRLRPTHLERKRPLARLRRRTYASSLRIREASPSSGHESRTISVVRLDQPDEMCGSASSK